MAQVYVEKARQVTAEQFHVAVVPWPTGVDACDRLPDIPHYHYPNDQIRPLNEGDWIVAEHRTGYKSVMSDAEFRGTFNVPGPPVGETQPA